MLTIKTGGQSGIDEGAIEGAALAMQMRYQCEWRMIFPRGMRRESPMPTWMKTAVEKRPTWVTEASSNSYQDRTRAVVNASCAVLMITRPEEQTPGSALTVALANERHIPVWHFQNVHNKAAIGAECGAIAYWLGAAVMPLWHTTCVGLMVAGPRGSKWEEGTALAKQIVSLVVARFHESRKEFRQ